MANLKKLIEYQNVDIELYKLLVEIDKYEHNKKMQKAKDEFAAAKTQVSDSDAEAGAIIGFYEKAEEYHKTAEKSIKKISDKLEKLSGEESEKQRKELIAEIESIKDSLLDLERELSNRKTKSDGVIKSYIEAQEKGKKIRDIFILSKTKTEEFVAAKEPKINELKAKLKDMESSLDKKYLEQYKILTAEKKYPALVVASTMDGGRTFNCSGCGIELSQKAKDELIDKDASRCENCRRIIYKAGS